MFLMSASLTDITSNARLKVYPSTTVLQVANSPIFRRPGYEPRTREYDVPPKGNAADSDRSKESSLYRARASVRDIALCNRFGWFFTWTLSKEPINRYDSVEVGRRVQDFLKNAVRRKGFAYVCVPERHKDGAIHFHGLCNLGSIVVERAVHPRTLLPLSTIQGQPIFNMTSWKLGYSTCIPIDENYERTCNYIVKYISKDSDKVFGKWYLSSRNLVKHPPIELVDGGMDYEGFRNENPDLPEIPLYRDVCMVSMQLVNGKGGSV